MGNEAEDWDSARRSAEVEACRRWEGLEYGARDVVACVVDQCTNVGMIRRPAAFDSFGRFS